MNTFSKSVIGVLVCGVVGVIVSPMFADAKESSGPMPGSQFLSQMGRGLLVYAEANGMKLPPADVWRDRIDPYVDANGLGMVRPDLAFHTRGGRNGFE